MLELVALSFFSCLFSDASHFDVTLSWSEVVAFLILNAYNFDQEPLVSVVNLASCYGLSTFGSHLQDYQLRTEYKAVQN
ncbi:hypothetical protein T4E_2466 [Trichinella pseudospiralis]|uniref:Uncharacterized protein n=1 Tax=Trichinella pseudospiralis TaxID=6337 RepID=A0A0V0Y7M0_TRIPS|nr:hypothetical protein T4E_2466 [Trichinella pseudospiralis]